MWETSLQTQKRKESILQLKTIIQDVWNLIFWTNLLKHILKTVTNIQLENAPYATAIFPKKKFWCVLQAVHCKSIVTCVHFLVYPLKLTLKITCSSKLFFKHLVHSTFFHAFTAKDIKDQFFQKLKIIITQSFWILTFKIPQFQGLQQYLLKPFLHKIRIYAVFKKAFYFNLTIVTHNILKLDFCSLLNVHVFCIMKIVTT